MTKSNMKTLNGYADLCVPYLDDQDQLLGILNEMIASGYKTVAIEQIYKHDNVSSKNGDQIPAPKSLDKLKELTNDKLNLINRLTIIYSDPSVTHTMARSNNFKKFHIIAALPTTEAALQHACQTFQGDIITYNSNSIRIRINRKFYYLAVRRNIFFELKYSPVIVDSNERRATITRAQQYHMSGKSKSIIISSEAKTPFQIRSPFDVSSLGCIFGLSEEQAKSSISTETRKVLIAAESRRLGRAPVLAKYEDVDTSTSEEEEEDEEMISSKRPGETTESASKRMKTF